MGKKNKSEKDNLNTIYISERLKKYMRPASDCALTAVIAPMGYGKTTAVNWLLTSKMKADNAVVIKISIYSDNLSIFWMKLRLYILQKHYVISLQESRNIIFL